LIDLSLFVVSFCFSFWVSEYFSSIDMSFRLFLFGFDFDVDTASEEL
jgi:hypothetical protein